MFEIKNNRLYYQNISFSLPNGLYLNTNYEASLNNRIVFQSKNNSFSLSLTFVDYKDTTENYAIAERQAIINGDFFIYGDNHPDVKPIKEINLYGLHGFSYLYSDNLKMYFETTSKNTHIYILIESSDNMEDIIKQQEVQALFNSIKFEHENVSENGNKIDETE